ncbi:hypothetical protein K504DRAFT_138720 [Pleomassaria siparia CBS 279.74]|uniref:Uncharacterized protein n=1 Tax=Pleomassaria siparia CBS 279.74 TaxID=1314801 RepID=A0A6G1KLR1_9PLEO|nr:hypothetical protein K504DRAFT_138720 [Pleomassaria siparia CBS 279.74]
MRRNRIELHVGWPSNGRGQPRSIPSVCICKVEDKKGPFLCLVGVGPPQAYPHSHHHHSFTFLIIIIIIFIFIIIIIIVYHHHYFFFITLELLLLLLLLSNLSFLPPSATLTPIDRLEVRSRRCTSDNPKLPLVRQTSEYTVTAIPQRQQRRR